MRVLVGPRINPATDMVATAVSHALAGPEGSVVSLLDSGIKDLSRPLSGAEVALLRGVLTGEDAIVGYVCKGRRIGAGSHESQLAVVTDHANLTWRSPLTGPNDDRIGPRFPSMTGVYAPEIALDRLEALDGMIVESGVLAGVRDDGHLSLFEEEVARAQGHVAASSELAPVVIVAAHLGLRVAAVAVMTELLDKGEG